MSAPILEVENVTRRFGNFVAETSALSVMDLRQRIRFGRRSRVHTITLKAAMVRPSDES